MCVHGYFYCYTTESNPLRPSGDNSTSIMVIVAVATSASASFVLLLLVCGVIVILLLRSRSSKDVSTDRVPHPSHTEPFYETVLPRILKMDSQDQDFELKDNIAYGPLCSPAVTTSRDI